MLKMPKFYMLFARKNTFPQILGVTVKIFWQKDSKENKTHSFSISPNLCQRTTVLNADVPNCYITQ